LSAIAPDHSVLLLGRIVAALCHGSFSGIGSLVARGQVAPERKSRAVAVMFAGRTLANVPCAPFGALVGERWGWRAAFWVVTAIGVLAPAGIIALVPGGAGAATGYRAPLCTGAALTLASVIVMLLCCDREGLPESSRRPVRCIARRSIARVLDVLG
jgi:predicted MFS family arabinose efflux permease